MTFPWHSLTLASADPTVSIWHLCSLHDQYIIHYKLLRVYGHLDSKFWRGVPWYFLCCICVYYTFPQCNSALTLMDSWRGVRVTFPWHSLTLASADPTVSVLHKMINTFTQCNLALMDIGRGVHVWHSPDTPWHLPPYHLHPALDSNILFKLKSKLGNATNTKYKYTYKYVWQHRKCTHLILKVESSG